MKNNKRSRRRSLTGSGDERDVITVDAKRINREWWGMEEVRLRSSSFSEYGRGAQILQELEEPVLTQQERKRINAIIAEARAVGDGETLDLGRKGLLHLPGEEIINLAVSSPTVKRLRLNVNALSTLPLEVGALYALEVLNLSFNRLTSLPPELGALSSLKKLHLNNNLLTSIPPEISSMSSLQRLYLHNNCLRSLPPELGSLKSLQRLYLSDNNLAYLPPEFGRLTALQKLYVSNNILQSLPKEMAGLSSLEVLHLPNNLLCHLPRELAAIDTLKRLYLPKNRFLKAVPWELRDMKSLTSVWVDSSWAPEGLMLAEADLKTERVEAWWMGSGGTNHTVSALRLSAEITMHYHVERLTNLCYQFIARRMVMLHAKNSIASAPQEAANETTTPKAKSQSKLKTKKHKKGKTDKERSKKEKRGSAIKKEKRGSAIKKEKRGSAIKKEKRGSAIKKENQDTIIKKEKRESAIKKAKKKSSGNLEAGAPVIIKKKSRRATDGKIVPGYAEALEEWLQSKKGRNLPSELRAGMRTRARHCAACDLVFFGDGVRVLKAAEWRQAGQRVSFDCLCCSWACGRVMLFV